MRTKEEMQSHEEKLRFHILIKCKKCRGTDSNCSCLKRYQFCLSAYEACIPKDFWTIEEKDITHNKRIFQKTVLKYVSNLKKILASGYGLVFLGDNGVGKTYFTSYVLTRAIRAGYSTYYTTMPQLEHDMMLGFRKGNESISKRLDWFLTSDFLAIDEVGKEKRRGKGEAYVNVQLERILKQRCDDSMPVLLATNMDKEEFEEWHGSTISSIIAGKYQPVIMEPGDFRKKMARKMKKDMGY